MMQRNFNLCPTTLWTSFGCLKVHWSCLSVLLPAFEENFIAIITFYITLQNICEEKGHDIQLDLPPQDTIVMEEDGKATYQANRRNVVEATIPPRLIQETITAPEEAPQTEEEEQLMGHPEEEGERETSCGKVDQGMPHAASTPVSAKSSDTGAGPCPEAAQEPKKEAEKDEGQPEVQEGNLEAVLTSINTLQGRCMHAFCKMNERLTSVEWRQRKMERRLQQELDQQVIKISNLQEALERLQKP